MKYGFIKAAAASLKLRVGDTLFNLEQAKSYFDEAEAMGTNVLVLPELYLSAYTCGDLFTRINSLPPRVRRFWLFVTIPAASAV